MRLGELSARGWSGIMWGKGGHKLANGGGECGTDVVEFGLQGLKRGLWGTGCGRRGGCPLGRRWLVDVDATAGHDAVGSNGSRIVFHDGASKDKLEGVGGKVGVLGEDPPKHREGRVGRREGEVKPEKET